MRILICTFLVSFFVLNNSYGQDAAEKPKDFEPKLNENLVALQPFVGTWTIDTKIGSAQLGGERNFKAKAVYEIGMDGNFLVGKTYELDSNGKYHQTNHEIWRWNNEKNKVVSHAFSVDGNYREVEQTVETKDGKLTVSNIWAKKGSPVPVQRTFRFIDENSFGWKVLSITKNPVVDGVWKRLEQK